MEAQNIHELLSQTLTKPISGCYIINNESTPAICEGYNVVYSDGTKGTEFFNGNVWLTTYHHPVAMWWLRFK